MLVTPVLVHIGYHKTATKWLRGGLFCNSAAGYRWLGKAPASPAVNNLIFARPLDFDAAEIRGEFEPLFADAEAAGLLPVVCFGRLSGHPFSGGYDSKLIADRLKDVLPEARILIVIREQRSMIVSTYKQYVKGGGVCTLEHFLEPATEQGWHVPGFDYRHFEYDRLIAHYHELYGKESVLVLPTSTSSPTPATSSPQSPASPDDPSPKTSSTASSAPGGPTKRTLRSRWP